MIYPERLLAELGDGHSPSDRARHRSGSHRGCGTARKQAMMCVSYCGVCRLCMAARSGGLVAAGTGRGGWRRLVQGGCWDTRQGAKVKPWNIKMLCQSSWGRRNEVEMKNGCKISYFCCRRDSQSVRRGVVRAASTRTKRKCPTGFRTDRQREDGGIVFD